MAIPLSKLIFDPIAANAPAMHRYREIENHYHLEMVAENTAQLVEFQAASLNQQAETARLNLRMSDGLDELNATAAATLDAINQQTEVLHKYGSMIAKRLLAQQKTLREITELLRRPYQTQMLELREQADKWLTSGMRNTGQERKDDYKDAMQLLKEVIKNPIGNQDYVTWFQIGWILWKHSAVLTEAEKAFYRASRLSAPDANEFHSLSLRHLAHMQYLQGKYEDAYQTVQKVVDIARDSDALFDAARYAAKTNRGVKSLAFLEKCIELVPTTIITMFAEEDFKA